MKNFDENTRFTLQQSHASEPDGDDDLDAFILHADDVPLFEIRILRDNDSEAERSITVKRMPDVKLSASDLPGVCSSVHLGCVVYLFLCEQIATDTRCPEFFADLFTDDDGNDVFLPINLHNIPFGMTAVY